MGRKEKEMKHFGRIKKNNKGRNSANPLHVSSPKKFFDHCDNQSRSARRKGNEDRKN
jgi:hypothetical protein